VHEYSLVAALVERVEAEAGARGEVRRVHVRIGELAGVEIELFRTAYETFRAGSLLAGAELVVLPVEARWDCSRCGSAIARGARLACPACGSAARLVAGDEMILDRIEMEVPDV